MRYIRHPQPRTITLSNGTKVEAKFAEMVVGHIDSMSPAFGKTMKGMRIAIDAIRSVESTVPGQMIEMKEETFALVKQCFEEPEKFGAMMHVAMWRHVFDWAESIIDAPEKEPAIENVTPIGHSNSGVNTKPAKAGAK